MSGEVNDPAKAFAGAQFRVARRKKGLSQRQLYAEKLISPAALSHFEKGLSWPRARMQTKLEERIGLPAGQIEAWRRGYRGPESSVSTLPTEHLMVAALQVAVSGVESGIAAIPAPDDPGYWNAVLSNLRDLRKLDTTVAAAARVVSSVEVLGTLRAVRRRYDELIRAAAVARPHEVGPQLYVARTAAQMSTDEAAAAAGVAESTINDVESCQIEAPREVQALLLRLRTD